MVAHIFFWEGGCTLVRNFHFVFLLRLAIRKAYTALWRIRSICLNFRDVVSLRRYNFIYVFLRLVAYNRSYILQHVMFSKLTSVCLWWWKGLKSLNRADNFIVTLTRRIGLWHDILPFIFRNFPRKWCRPKRCRAYVEHLIFWRLMGCCRLIRPYSY